MPDLKPVACSGGPPRPRVAEFFAGIGLVRIGLERAGFDVVWANDLDPDKHDMYVRNFGTDGAETFALGDVANVTAADLPDDLALAWASFPCTDLSVAGARRGLAGSQSSTFWEFTRVLRELGTHRPPVVALENVVGLATSHGGDDLTAAIRELNDLGYSVDLLAIDARRFVPQSRPRLFVVGATSPPADDAASSELRPDWLQTAFGDSSLVTHRAALPPPPPPLTGGLSSLVEDVPVDDARWWDVDRTAAFVDSLSPMQADRLDALQRRSRVAYRTAYRRTRRGLPTWEVRPDDISGCLRTARGGSSKQAVVRVGRGDLLVRWMSPVEYARLMGAGDYRLAGTRTNQALCGFGDAVCAPVVEWLAVNYLMPLVAGRLESGIALALADG